jgi:hypothetical protein
MYSAKFEDELALVDDLVKEVATLFEDKDVTPLQAIVICDQLKMMSQDALCSWMGMYQGVKEQRLKSELKEAPSVKTEEKE